MKRIAICGPSGVGKGYVSKMITSLYGFPVLDTDNTVHQMYEKDEDLILRISRLFGAEVVKDGKIHRPALRNIVFESREALELLNKTVHQRVRDYTIEWFFEMEKKGYPAAFVDIPQIIESGMADDFDIIIGVIAHRNTRISRIIQRDGISLPDAEKRLGNQLPIEEYIKICHYIINNDGDGVESTLRKIFSEVNIIEKSKTEQ